jgi:hypothetical protein
MSPSGLVDSGIKRATACYSAKKGDKPEKRGPQIALRTHLSGDEASRDSPPD